MPSRRSASEHQDAVSRRLALLSAELAGDPVGGLGDPGGWAWEPSEDLTPGERDAEGDWSGEHTRVRAQRPAAATSGPGSRPPVRPPVGPPPPGPVAVPVPGRHAARRRVFALLRDLDRQARAVMREADAARLIPTT